MRKRSVVRVVVPDPSNEMIEWFCEHLRYAGVVQVHQRGGNALCFDILPPPNTKDEIWAKQCADRMKSFSVNAVVAPEVL